MVARLRGPGDLVVAAPYLTGFRPEASIVAIATARPRQQIRLTVRLDLPPEPADGVAVRGCVAVLVQGLLRAEPEQVHALLYPDLGEDPALRGGRLPRRELVTALGSELARHGVHLAEAVCVVPTGDGQDRYWSYLCPGPYCCPPEGTVTDDTTGTDVRFAFVTSGRQVHARREELVASLAPLPDDDPAVVRLGKAVLRELGRCTTTIGPDRNASPRWRRETAHAVNAMLEGAGADADGDEVPRLDDDQRALLAVAMIERQVRDVLVAEAIRADRVRGLVEVLRTLVPLLDPEAVAPVAGALAAVAYYSGEGALAWVAIDRALEADPTQSMALLVARAIEIAMPPEEAMALVTTAVPSVSDWDGEPLPAPTDEPERRTGTARAPGRRPGARRRAG